MKKNKNKIVSVEDLTFLRDRNHPYNWFQRHWVHHRLRRRLRKAKTVLAKNETVAKDLSRYYFVPKDKIIIR